MRIKKQKGDENVVREAEVLEYINSVAQFGASDLQRTFNIGYSDTVKMLDRLTSVITNVRY